MSIIAFIKDNLENIKQLLMLSLLSSYLSTLGKEFLQLFALFFDKRNSQSREETLTLVTKIAHSMGLCATILSPKSSITPQNGPKSVSRFAFSNAKYHVRNVVF